MLVVAVEQRISAWGSLNAEGVPKFQPRVARASALPWEINEEFRRNREGVAELVNTKRGRFAITRPATLSGLRMNVLPATQGSALARATLGWGY